MNIRRAIIGAATLAVSLVPLTGMTAAHATDTQYCGITVVGTRAADRIVGTECDDNLYGLGGNDTIRGRLGEDNIWGGRGDDLLTDSSFLAGGTIHGGRGWDTCVVPENSNVQLFNCEVIEEL